MAFPLRIDYPPVERDCDDLPRDELAACLQRLLRGQFKTSAARDILGEVSVNDKKNPGERKLDLLEVLRYSP